MFFLQLLISGFVNYIHKLAHVEVYSCLFLVYIFLHMLNKINIIANFNYKNAKLHVTTSIFCLFENRIIKNNLTYIKVTLDLLLNLFSN